MLRDLSVCIFRNYPCPHTNNPVVPRAMIWILLLLQIFGVSKALIDYENEGDAELARREDSSMTSSGISSSDVSSADTSATAESSDTSATSELSESKTTSESASSSSLPGNIPAGGISLTSPESTSSTYIKAGAKVTFGWNYTSVVRDPSGLNIEIGCSKNSQTYTIAQNQSFSSSSIVWDTNKVTKAGGLHLINADYTLMIYDSSKSYSDQGSPGELSPFEYTFSVYIPQSYTAWAPAAKYVNVSVRLNSPQILTVVLVTLFSAFVYIL